MIAPDELTDILKAGIHYTTFAQIMSLVELMLVAKSQSQSADLSWQIS